MGSSPTPPIDAHEGERTHPVNLLDLVYLPLAILTAPLWLRKKRGGWSERFGRIEPMLSDRWRGRGESRVVLLHAVSVGEVSALRALVPKLTPHATVVVSVTTDTGLERARALFGGSCEIVRYPLDFSWCVRRFLRTIEPDAVALVELELWPNFVGACARRGIPIGIINGRISTRSFKGYRKLRWGVARVLGKLDFVCVQDDAYAGRARALGADPERLRVTGSMKWDAIDLSDTGDGPSEAALALADDLGIDLSRPLVVAGSTGPGEEAMLDGAVPAGAQLVCAPRRPERFDEAAGALGECRRRSDPDSGDPGTDRFLLDTIGELSLLYELADLVVVGRSFGDLHGSDPLEPAALGKPVLIGPAYADFRSQVETLRDAGAIGVVPGASLGETIGAMLGDEDERRAMGTRARACVREHQGASAAHARVLVGVLGLDTNLA